MADRTQRQGFSQILEACESGAVEKDFWREHAANPGAKDPITHPTCEVPQDELAKERERPA